MRKRRTHYGIGIELHEELVAYALYRFARYPVGLVHLGRDVCFVDDIAVAAAHQRQGYTRWLLREVATRARASGSDDLLAVIWAGNDASATAFEQAGFRPEFTQYGQRLDEGGAS